MTHALTTLSGAATSRFAFGTMQFGGRADETHSAAMYADCRSAGISHFDTAFVYTDGNSERILGDLIRPHRNEVLIASKVGYQGGAGADNMRAQFDISRQRLQQDMVDVLYLHRFDPDTDLAETLACFAELKAEGKIRYVGLSNFAAWQVMKAQMIAAQFDLSIDILQPMYSLAKRQAEVEILPMCADQGIVAATYSPLGGGLLTGKYAGGDGSGRLTEDSRYNARYGQDWMHQCAASLARLAAQEDVSPVTLAVAWVAAHATRPVPIISGRSAEQIAPALAALEYPLSDALYDALADLSPSPAPATDRLEEQTLGHPG